LLATPVISTDCPSGPREVLQDGRCGRLVACNDATALAQAIADVLAGRNPAAAFDPTPFLPATIIDRLEQLARESD
ncbi:MAG TPA: glycosyltransferase, partial [Accumulibacter sp.]|nr:glycosyltransferase [Accumulibacter sp.]